MWTLALHKYLLNEWVNVLDKNRPKMTEVNDNVFIFRYSVFIHSNFKRNVLPQTQINY
jgi:hypothetical protein